MSADASRGAGSLDAAETAKGAGATFGYEAARHDGVPQVFPTMADALRHLAGSRRDTTRPFLRVNSPRIRESFLVVGGRKQDAGCLSPPPRLPPQDQALLDAWQYDDPDMKQLRERLDARASEAEYTAPRMRG